MVIRIVTTKSSTTSAMEVIQSVFAGWSCSWRTGVEGYDTSSAWLGWSLGPKLEGLRRDLEGGVPSFGYRLDQE